jgi:hypothetical protein
MQYELQIQCTPLKNSCVFFTEIEKEILYLYGTLNVSEWVKQSCEK